MHIRTYRGVQALRLVSAVIVVAFHACHWFNRDAGSGRTAPEIQLLGDMCVWTFFLISGFVVMHVVDSGREPDWKTFAMRRAIRILPLAWLLTSVKIFAALLAPAAMFDGALTPTRIAASFLLVPSRDPDGSFRTLWGVEWTLVFEMAFYALVAVAIAVRVDPLRLAGPVLLAVAIVSIWRPAHGGSVLWFYADPVVLFLLLGMCIGRATRTRRLRATAFVGIAAAVLYGVVQVLRGAPTGGASAPVFAVLVGAFALVVVSERRFGVLVPDWVVRGGEIAFALYLTHPLVAQAVPRLLGRASVTGVPWWPVVVMSVALSIPLGWAVHRYVDVPLGRTLRRRLIRRTPPVQAR